MTIANLVIVVLGRSDDFHVASVCEALQRRRIDPILLDPEVLFLVCQIGERIRLAGRVLDEDARIWDRLKLFPEPETHDEAARMKYVAQRESVGAVREILGACAQSGLHVLDAEDRKIAASRKHATGHTARRLGIRPPDTLITNDLEAAFAFKERHGRIVMKPLNIQRVIDPFDPENIAVFLTREITDDDLATCTASDFLQHPICLQELVEKRFERRVFATTDAVEGFVIPAQRGSLASIDWRVEEFSCGYRHEKCPERIEAFCRDFLKAYQLSHGVFDFAESTAGETIFFECNPAGQWSVPPQYCNVDISKLIADQILKGAVDV